MTTLYEIMEKYYKDFSAKQAVMPKIVVKDSFPIVWFGNTKKFFNSKIKVITIGLNPSFHEFPETDSELRFPRARDAFARHRMDEVCNSLNGYFDANRVPYWDWFKAYERVLGFLKCGVTYGGIQSRCPLAENYALHIDFYSAIATNPTYGNLGKTTKTHLARVDLFRQLFSYLTDGCKEPVIVLFSTSKDAICHCLELTQSDKIYECVVAGDGKVEAYRRGNKYFIWGKPNIKPFQGVKNGILKSSLNAICGKIGV